MKRLQVQRPAHLVIAGGIAAVAAVEWLHGLADVWAWLSGAAGLAAAAITLSQRPRRAAALLAGLAALALGVRLVVGVLASRQIECCWPRLREARVTNASHALGSTLSQAVAEARRLAERGATAAWLPAEAAFDRLQSAASSGGSSLERGVVVLDSLGEPVAWAGRHRFLPAPDSTELRAIITPFYVALEARRQTNGRTAVGTVLLDASPAVADRSGALSVVFERRHGVALRFSPPAAAPRDSDVFDFCPVACDQSPDTLFSVEPVPPSQGDAKLASLARVTRDGAVLLAATILLLVAAAPAGRWRWTLIMVAAWAAARASFSPTVAPGALFSPATFYRPLLRDFTASAGALAALGLLMLLAAAALWRRGLERRPWSYVLAGALLLFAPYLVRYLGRGIAPPAAGVSVALWLSWELALAAAGMAMVLAAAALVRGPREPERPSWIIIASAGWAVLAAVTGLWLWQPYGAWPEWYTFLWLPALAGAIVPAPRRWALFGIATVAGTAAALVTWGAAVEGRLNLARRDAERLGSEPDPLAIAELERLGQQVLQSGDIRTDADLYAVWSGSPLARQEYPTVLAAWNASGEEIAELRLAALDLRTPLLAALARSATAGVQVTRIDRIPGVHYVLVAKLKSGELLTVGVGPRSRLVPANRVARFLRGDPGVEPPFGISISLPKLSETPPGARVRWERVGWAARGHRSLELPDGTRHVHVLVELRGPWVPLERGTLVVFIDLLLIAVAWLLSRMVSEGWVPRLPSAAAAVASYRGRLATVLAAFFVIPLLVFALWSVARLGDSAREAGDLLIRQTVRDAAASAGEMPGGEPALADEVTLLGRQLDADLWIYKGGTLAGTSDPVLGELGLIDPLLAPAVYRRLALEDELELTTDAHAAGRLTRVGYHVMAEGAPVNQVVLAVPQLVNDEAVRRQEQDLGFTLVLATLVGLVAAVGLAGATSRRLAQPVSALREAALAVGRGETPPPFPPDAPSEFSPVLTAFDRMVLDIRNGRQALEEARRRTAQVLATVATGVVAVDERLVVTMANPRAEELLDATLAPGVVASAATGSLWKPIWEAVGAFVARPGAGTVSREFALGGRQIRVQLAAIDAEGDAGGGCVVALDDTTDLARASRVLAWGEMARQVAHEIKNPLTPIRLGIQHLQRARTAGGRAADFDRTLSETGERILAEIDRLDAIARAFSRFGAPGAEQAPLEAVDLFAVAREVVQLYALGDAPGIALVTLAGSADSHAASARKDEVKEVLLNLVENARNADARRITVRVAAGGLGLAVEDDGRGIAPDALDHVFEPTFSTTSSGSGLGLAIAKRLVENWGGGIAITSVVGKGTTVSLTLKPAFRSGAG